jgi:hypothetical protein
MVALGLSASGVFFGSLAAQEPLRWARNERADSRPIQISADDAVTWLDQGKRIFLLKGKVWIEQGDAHLRAGQAVVWVDEALKQRSGVYHLNIYSEGGVSLEVDTHTYEAPVSMIELNTRGQIGVKTFKSKVVQEKMLTDPLYQRAVAGMSGQAAPANLPQPPPQVKNPIQQVTHQDVPPPVQPPAGQPAPPQTMLPPAWPPAKNPAGQPGAPPGTTPSVQVLPVVRPPDPAVQIVPVVQPPEPTVQAPQVVQPPTVVPLPGPPGSSGSAQPVPIVPAPAPRPVPVPPPGAAAKPVAALPQQVSIRPRSSAQFKIREFPMGDGEKAVVFSPGVIIDVTDPATKGMVDIEADRVVLWTRGDVRELVEGLRSPQGQSAHSLEFYLSGNVEIRSLSGKESRVLRCNEAYYDVGRKVALALDADLEVKQPGLPDPVHLQGPEIQQLNEKLFAMPRSKVDASKLPYGPGLYLETGPSSLEEKRIEKKTIFGTRYFKRDTGEPEFEEERLFRGENVVLYLEDLPVFWLPYIQGDVNDPLGPLQSLSVGYNRVFGFQFYSSFNVFDLIGIDPVKDTRWRLNADYLSQRGPSLGTDFNTAGNQLAGISGKYDINIKAMGINDTGTDILGGNRGVVTLSGFPPTPPTATPITHPDWRGRFLGQLNWQELPYNLTVQTQVAAISDRNFLEQYYNLEWVNGLNQETFLYVKQQENNWAWTFLAEPRIRNWVTETEWLPKIDGYWIGQDVLQMFSYTARADAAFAHLEPTHQPPPPFEQTDIATATGRLDLWQELDLPLQLGAFRVVPYGVLDLTYYSQDIQGNDQGRLYAGGGIRGSIPFSRLYPDIQSELFNLNGIYHKIVVSGNWYWVHSNVSHTKLPQLDQLNDNETDQALRDIRPYQPSINPANAQMLLSGFFDPQLFALRKLVLNKIDTLDSIDEVQLGIRQRWQTKRGFPGQQHIIDWMTLDVQASFFPQPNRDNFGEVVNFVEYNWSWSIGDRTTLFSSGWFDPHEGGGRVVTIGAELNRPDRSSLYIAYNQIDPLESKQVLGAVTIPFSAKYSLTASSAYDFGVNSQINALTVTRTGTDLMVTLGFTYNSILNNFGFVFEVYPNLLPANKRVPGITNLLAQTQTR